MSFNQDILAKDTNLYPVVIINKDGDSPIYISTNSTTIGGQYYSPVLLNVPALRESIDIEKRNYKISNITLSIPIMNIMERDFQRKQVIVPL